MNIDTQILAATFASRVRLAKLTLEEATDQAQAEWKRTQRWVASESEKEGSFMWFCDEFELDASAVRRAIREKAQ